MIRPIGEIKTTVKVHCTICNQKHKRLISELVYENTKEEIEGIKARLKVKASKPYTCRVCKTISLNK